MNMYFCESNLVEGHFFPRKLCISIDLISVATQNFVEGNMTKFYKQSLKGV